MKRNYFKMIFACATIMCMVGAISCGGGNDDDNKKTDVPTPSPAPDPEPDGEQVAETMAKGADVSWLTEMEKTGKKFYASNGQETECMKLLRNMGANAIRLRVWVNPDGGWCAKDDVVEKAKRAQVLGMRLMIDFHYSDFWADPSRQEVPAAWQKYTFEEMKAAISDHTKDVLQALKAQQVKVEWVQVGNETRDGMLWGKNTGSVNSPKWDEPAATTGRASKNAKNFAAYVLSGYNAVKAVYPDAKVVVHVNNGHEIGAFTWLFDLLKNNGAKWDVIGMSLYPEDNAWKNTVNQCLQNIKTLQTKYSTPVVISEFGMNWNSSNAATALKTVVNGCRAIEKCEGVFYWEPEVYGGWKPALYDKLGWNAYTKGAFDNSGRPTNALNAYK